MMSSLIVVGLALIILLLSVLLGKKNKLFADRFLILYLTFAAFWHVYTYIEYSGLLLNSYWMLMGKGIYLLHAPFLFLYIYALTAQKKLQTKHYVVLFLPFIIYTVHFFYYYLLVFDGAALSINHGLLYINGGLSTTWLIFAGLFLIIDPIFLIVSYYLLKTYKKSLLIAVSNTDQINLNWLNVLFYLWLAISVILVPFGTLTVGSGWFSTEFLDILSEILSVAFFFILGFYGFKQTTIFTNLELKGELPSKPTSGYYQRSGLSTLQAKAYHEQLLTLMEEKKPYLNGELTAGELSKLLGISVNHLSQVLNKEQKQNFFDFVNSYRIKEVLAKMKEPGNDHLTLLAIALNSGFNSKTSFNTIFKKATNQTPSQYYQSLKR
ncbi:MAG: helix-turn-helix transcriptional regulator [Imperialibacter sp.]|uniref:helix-turn-helix domain-containing protein n=1 Tax=Imperialibacter sp. TaxID=2038411 RepID=UPI0032EDE105